MDGAKEPQTLDLLALALSRIESLEKKQISLEERINVLERRNDRSETWEQVPPQPNQPSFSLMVADTNDDEKGSSRGESDNRHRFQLSKVHSSWLHRSIYSQWAKEPSDGSSFQKLIKDKSKRYKPALHGDLLASPEYDNQSPLCQHCKDLLISGKFSPELNGVRRHYKVLSTAFTIRRSDIISCTGSTCAFCRIIANTLRGAEQFRKDALSSGLADDETFGVAYFTPEEQELLAVLLNFCGTTQCIMAFQVEIQMNTGAKIVSPCFRVFAEPGCDYDHLFISQPYFSDMASSPAIAQAKTWIERCSERHPHCKLSSHGQLPTRVLDVSPEGDHSIVRMTEGHGLRREYISLSYCWGDSQTHTLTSKNHEEFQRGIPLDTLPQTIIDAINISRQLGVKYLWVDSLCIMQDSQSDKQHEISNMAAVYQNSYVTIVAASSDGASTGFLYPRPQLHISPLRIPFRLRSSEPITALRLYEADQLPLFDATHNPTEGRGWTLQEKLLSHRMLIYSANLLHWVCRSIPIKPTGDEMLQGQLLVDMDDVSSEQVGGGLTPKRNDAIYQSWEGTIFQFTQRSLKYASDSLAAVAGIATEYQKELQDTYVAGLWKNALPRELLWEGPLASDPGKLKPRPSRYIAPSWSWASRQGPVSFRVRKHSEVLPTITVQHCSVTLRNPRLPFGDVVDGNLIIRGPVKRAWQLSIGLFDPNLGIGDGRKLVASALLDTQEELSNPARMVTCLRLTQNEGLLLKPVMVSDYGPDDASKYQRVGTFHVHTTKWFEDCTDAELYIV